MGGGRDAAQILHTMPLSKERPAPDVGGAHVEKRWFSVWCGPTFVVLVHWFAEWPLELIRPFLCTLLFTQRRGFGSLGGGGISLILSDSLVPHKNQRPTEARTFPIAKIHNPQLLMILTLVSAQPEAALASVENPVMYLYLQSTFLIFMRNADKSWGQRENYFTPKWLRIFCLRVFQMFLPSKKHLATVDVFSLEIKDVNSEIPLSSEQL